jgi:Ni,Fe-hydrogenase I cytochrome b subunit
MELSELFLMSWAMIATGVAVYLNHKNEHYKMAIIVQQMGFKLIGEGKAKVIIEGDRVMVREV